MNTLLQDIKDRTNNIGSLVLFIKNHQEYLDFIESNIPYLIKSRQLSEKIFYFVNQIETSLDCQC